MSFKQRETVYTNLQLKSTIKQHRRGKPNCVLKIAFLPLWSRFVREGICECVPVPPACCHCGSRALPGVRCQMRWALCCVRMYVHVCGRTGEWLGKHPLIFSRWWEYYCPCEVTSYDGNSCQFWLMCVREWSTRTVWREEVCRWVQGQWECLAKRDGRSPVSVSAAVLRRHKVTLCFPRQISSAGEQSGIQHFNWLMLIKTFFVG